MDTGADREPRQERSRATRARLLEAAVACLAEHGAAGATVGAVARRAGVSRGAAQHHFPTREDLFLAALRHMLDSRGEELRRGAAAVPEGPGRTEAVVQMVVDAFTGVDFRAALQLWSAAASDPVLRERIIPMEERMGREVHRSAVALLDVDETVPGVRETVQATLDLARGLGLANLLTDDEPRRRRIVRQWARTLDEQLGERTG
ncbi:MULTISPECIES: TetR/AcrR family transcriptional regulator [Nocardiopsis]|uniref:AcrR family transcriptional regulator n=1 Tax=Nocardiopsis sinuspersici TaxID=501010 RepID=A0A1V3C2D7_9ACTN|nr:MULTISPECIES: TetR family transcriptional regulator [Nocardiopsis]NYH50984.1 AcrR family transcriptional regulator [Nocardiopsis sinuspersici]OOC54792.1 TetR family transcriptional regulator [Nocardiopsis sinuspersici]